MDLTSPISSVVPSVQGAVLAVLAETRVPLSGRQTAELTTSRASRRQVDTVLRRLVDAGIVLREVHPPAYLYRLNANHLAAPAIVALANLRAQFLARVRTEIETWTVAPVAVWFLGSAARGDGAPESDIDLLVLSPDRVALDDMSGPSSWISSRARSRPGPAIGAPSWSTP